MAIGPDHASLTWRERRRLRRLEKYIDRKLSKTMDTGRSEYSVLLRDNPGIAVARGIIRKYKDNGWSEVEYMCRSVPMFYFKR